jgi:hypothetical protein
MTEYIRRLTMVFEPEVFEEGYNELFGLTNAKGKAFLKENLPKKALWGQVFDEDGVRYGHKTSNMAEIFSKVLKGIRSLPVTVIASYTFDKCNEYRADLCRFKWEGAREERERKRERAWAAAEG